MYEEKEMKYKGKGGRECTEKGKIMNVVKWKGEIGKECEEVKWKRWTPGVKG